MSVNKNFSGDQFGWNSAHLVLTGSLTALQLMTSTGNYVGWNPGREAAKRFLHSIESLRFAAVQVKRFRRQWNLFSSVVLNYDGEEGERVLDMNANHYGTAADQQLQVFYVRAERSVTLLWEPHQLVTVNVHPHGTCACVKRVGSQVCLCKEGRKSAQLSSCRHGTTKRVYWSMKSHEERKLQTMSKNNWCCNLSFDNRGITRSNVEHIDAKTIYQTSVLPVQLVLNKETKDPLTLNEWMVRFCLNSNNVLNN